MEEGFTSCPHVVKYHRGGVDVIFTTVILGFGIRLVLLHHFRRHINERPQNGHVGLLPSMTLTRESKITQLNIGTKVRIRIAWIQHTIAMARVIRVWEIGNQNVLGLQVAVNDVFGVQHFHRLAQTLTPFPEMTLCVLGGCHEFCQRILYVFHDQQYVAIVVVADTLGVRVRVRLGSLYRLDEKWQHKMAGRKPCFLHRLPGLGPFMVRVRVIHG